jgi:hypothetical protein
VHTQRFVADYHRAKGTAYGLSSVVWSFDKLLPPQMLRAMIDAESFVHYPVDPDAMLGRDTLNPRRHTHFHTMVSLPSISSQLFVYANKHLFLFEIRY